MKTIKQGFTKTVITVVATVIITITSAILSVFDFFS